MSALGEDMKVDSLKAVQAEPLWEGVVAAMRRDIVLGELAPGAHLKEPLLAQRFGVSRLPVREAIVQLEREGLVRVEPRRGAFVVGIDDGDIADIYECRLLLEAQAVRRAAGRVSAPQVAALAAPIAAMAASVDGDQTAVTAADMAFHRQLVLLAESRALLSAWEPLVPLIGTLMAHAHPDDLGPQLLRSVEEHRAIAEALGRHDAAAAEALLVDHLTQGEHLVVTALAAVRGRHGVWPSAAAAAGL
jgi:GntR family transcriptional regulator of gluconate operon